MQKIFALFAFVAAIAVMTSCGGGSKIEGTPVEKANFTITQPEGWELLKDADDHVELKFKGEKSSQFITVKTSTEAYDKAMEYYLSENGGYKQVEEIKVKGGKLNVLKKDDRNSYFIIAPQGENTGATLKIVVGTTETKGDPFTNEQVKAVLESIVLK